jgi:hypothetical protein
VFAAETVERELPEEGRIEGVELIASVGESVGRQTEVGHGSRVGWNARHAEVEKQLKWGKARAKETRSLSRKVRVSETSMFSLSRDALCSGVGALKSSEQRLSTAFFFAEFSTECDALPAGTPPAPSAPPRRR